MWHWDIFDAKENKNLMEGGNIGDKVGEDTRDTRNKLRLYDANPTDSYNA